LTLHLRGLDDPSALVSTSQPDPTPAIESYATGSRYRHEADPEEILEAEIIDPERWASRRQAAADRRDDQGGRVRHEKAFSFAMENATIRMAPLLSGYHWRVETVDAPILWTCDRPVMPWPPTLRDRFEGLGYGNADEVRMPLSPVAMLILRRQPSMSPLRVDQRRFHDYNADIALQCYESSCASPGAVAG
jgi:Protein of unknown function (DUF4238)